MLDFFKRELSLAVSCAAIMLAGSLVVQLSYSLPADDLISSDLTANHKSTLNLYTVDLSQAYKDDIADALAKQNHTVKWHELPDDLSQADPRIPIVDLMDSMQTANLLQGNLFNLEDNLTDCERYLFPAVHISNPVQYIYWYDVFQQILSGEITDWQQLGGNPGAIEILAPPSAPQIDQITGEQMAWLEPVVAQIANAQTYSSYQQAIEFIENNPDGLTFLPYDAFALSLYLRSPDIGSSNPITSTGYNVYYPIEPRLLIALRTNNSLYPPKPEKQLAALKKALQTMGYTDELMSCFGTSVSLRAVGDIMLSRHVGTKIRESGYNTFPFQKTGDYLPMADITFGNLESPFYNQGEPVTEGMVFKAEPETISGLTSSGFDIVDLANNHFGNQGQAGMLYTFELLEQNGIQYYGAGVDATAAHQVEIVETRQGYKIGFLGYDDIPPYSYEATDDQAGFALVETGHDLSLQYQTDIQSALQQTDFLIVSFHWGTEYTADPTGRQKQTAHNTIEAGADMIISHHPHVVQAVEIYQDKMIVYSLGNFVFDQMWSLETQQGLIADITLIPGPACPTKFNSQSPISSSLVAESATSSDCSDRLVTLAVDFTPIRIHDYNQPDFVGQAEATQILNRVFAASDL